MAEQYEVEVEGPDYAARMREDEERPSMDGKPLPTKHLGEDELLEEMRERAAEAEALWSDNFDLAEDDVEFAEGRNQWPSEVRLEREEKHQPCLTLNNIPTFIERVVGEQRQNKQAIHVHPNDDASANLGFVGPDGKEIKAHVALEGLIRTIEFNSFAEAHYDTAFQHAVDGGFGWLRVFTRYVGDDSFDQELVIGSVKNRWSVLLGPADAPDKSDARYGFILSSMLRSDFERKHPKARIGALGDLPENTRNFWGTQERVSVAEYFTREDKARELLLLSNGQIGYLDELEGQLDGDMLMGGGQPVLDHEGQPIRVLRRRKVIAPCVYWRKVTAWSILEGGVKGLKTPFTTIPIVPVLGRTRDLRDGTEVLSSLHRHGKDAKRMDNYWMSAATERVALAPKAPFIGPAEAFEGFERFWERSNIDNQAYLPFNGDIAPQRVEPATMPVAEVAIASQMVDRVKSTIGIYDASLGAQSNETSRVAINARDRQSSTSNFTFGDNLSRAIRRVGLLVLEGIPKVYDTERSLPLTNPDNTQNWVKVNQQVTGPDGQPAVVNSMSKGRFTCRVQPGPAFITQRQEASENQMALVQAAPDLIPIIGVDVIRNQDWPGADQTAKRLMRSMDPRLLSKAEREELQEDEGPVDPATGQPQGQPVDPAVAQAQQAQAMQMQVMSVQAEADAEEARSKSAVAKAKVAEAGLRLRVAEVTAEADIAEARAKMAQAARTIRDAQQPPQAKPNGQEAPSNG